jgi:hypothetical protein
LEPAATHAVAHVYVATPKGVKLYDAASNGELTLVSGSPFAGKFTDMVTNGKYFYGTDGTLVYEESVGPTGALKVTGTTNPADFDSGSTGVSSLVLDHSGSYLYCNLQAGSGGKFYQSYSVGKSNGDLTYTGTAGNGRDYGDGVGPVHPLGNNHFAFSTQNYFTWYLAGFGIESNGALTSEIEETAFPIAKSGDGYNPYVITAGPTNQLIAAVYPQQSPPDGPTDGPTQLAVYTSDGSGILSTNSTYENMPVVQVGSVYDMNFSPSGKLLAVGGNTFNYTGLTKPTGLQVFHFNGASPITKYTGLLTTAPIDQIRWDNSNHLYAVSKSANKLYVFTVTPISASQAPGSPYTIAGAQRILVRPM